MSDNPAPTGGRAVDDNFTRTARKDGRNVVTLRRLQLGNQFIVESDVYPVGTMRVEPVRPGPYVFGTARKPAPSSRKRRWRWNTSAATSPDCRSMFRRLSRR